MTFGERLKKARKEKKLTQKELASQIGAAHNSISNWENDQNMPDPDTIQHLCWVLNVQPNYFFGAESQPLPSNILPMPKMKAWKVLGGTACGAPIFRELEDETVLAPADIDADFVFRCVGDSMINARIFDGDIVFVKSGPVEDGQIGVVRIEEEYTLKRIYRGPDYLELRPENPMYKAQIIRGEQENAEIVGRAVQFLSRVI